MSNPSDIANKIKTVAGYAGATISTDTDTDSALIIDSQGFEGLAYAVYAGAITDGTYKLKIIESDSATFADSGAEVASYQVQNSFTKTPTDNSNSVLKVGAKLSKRYAKLRVTSTGTTSGAVFKGAVAVLGGAHFAPVA